MPIEKEGTSEASIQYRNQRPALPREAAAFRTFAQDKDRVLLLRPQKSRIYFMRQVFDDPLSLSGKTVRRLGLMRTLQIGLSYLQARLFPRRPESTLEDFLIDRFGKRLFLLFFKSYTEKVWGVPCNEISAVWGVQRIKGLSLKSAVTHFFKSLFHRKSRESVDIKQKGTDTSLIEQFLYPKYGPGQLWEEVARLTVQSGGEVRLKCQAVALNVAPGPDGAQRIASVQVRDSQNETHTLRADYVFSTMPIQHLLRRMNTPIASEISTIAEGLVYRGFITVDLLVDRLLLQEEDGSPIKDNWI